MVRPFYIEKQLLGTETGGHIGMVLILHVFIFLSHPHFLLFPELRTDDRRITHRPMHGGVDRPLDAGFPSHLMELDQIKRETGLADRGRSIPSMDNGYTPGKNSQCFK